MKKAQLFKKRKQERFFVSIEESHILFLSFMMVIQKGIQFFLDVQK